MSDATRRVPIFIIEDQLVVRQSDPSPNCSLVRDGRPTSDCVNHDTAAKSEFV